MTGVSGEQLTFCPEWAERLVAWYERQGRDLPWRRDTDPYRVWVSEIMLQQTRIEAALEHYRRFMQALPTVADLAAVEEDALLKLWEGLGYYSRARNLKKAACVVMEQYDGQLPASYDALLALPGIGEYTAGAIASISFGIPVPAVDGNVLRVLARLTASRQDVLRPAVKKEFTRLAARMVPPQKPGVFNQAIMELGETVCLPYAAPECGRCPLADLCEASRLGCAGELPVRSPKKERRVEHRCVLVVLRQEKGMRQVLLAKRPAQGLLAGLWELPSLEGSPSGEDVRRYAASWLGGRIKRLQPLGPARHLFSHIEWKMQGVCLWVDGGRVPSGCVWAELCELETVYALPSAFSAYTRQIGELAKQEDGR